MFKSSCPLLDSVLGSSLVTQHGAVLRVGGEATVQTPLAGRPVNRSFMAPIMIPQAAISSPSHCRLKPAASSDGWGAGGWGVLLRLASRGAGGLENTRYDHTHASKQTHKDAFSQLICGNADFLCKGHGK